MLTAADLAAMRAVQETALPDTATRTRTTLAQTDGGGWKASSTATATYACRVSSRGVPSEYLTQGAMAGSAPVMVTLPYDADVLADDTLTIGGVTYQVIGFASVGAWATAKRVVCEATS